MKWIGERISFEETKHRTTIIIDSNKNALINALMGSWLAMWYTIGMATLIYSFNYELTRQETLIVIVFIIFWTYYAFRVSKAFLWLVYGKEYIKIDEVGLHLKKSVLSFGKSNVFLFGNINELQFDIPEKGSWQMAWESAPWINGGERITFDYYGKIIRFGRKLNEKDTKLLFNLVAKRIQERNKR